jgi:lipopolysaccharide transport system ATP-binding protein
MPDSEPLISMRHVGVRYDFHYGLLHRRRPFWALKDISLDVHHGEVLGVVGRNGAGKTTLLQVMAGILRPDRGSITSNGCQPLLLSLQVGFVQHLTGRENAILSGMLLGLSRRDVVTKMDAIIELSELADFIDEPLETYSLGMRLRLGFAVAMQTNPDVLLLDEALGVGDAVFRVKSAAAMREKIRANRTVVLVSHFPDTLRELCHRVVWVEQGMVVMEGEVDSVLDAYGSRQSGSGAHSVSGNRELETA